MRPPHRRQIPRRPAHCAGFAAQGTLKGCQNELREQFQNLVHNHHMAPLDMAPLDDADNDAGHSLSGELLMAATIEAAT